MPNQRNVEYLKRIKKKIESGRGFYFTDFRGLNVKSMTDLRRALREKEIDYLVVKNRLLRLALKESGLDPTTLKDLLEGQIGLAIGLEDAYQPARILSRMEKEMPPFTIKGALIDGDIFIKERLKLLCSLPGKQEIENQMVNLLLNPIARLAIISGQLLSMLVITLEEIKKRRTDDAQEKVVS